MPDPRTLDRMWVGHPAAAAGAEFFSTSHLSSGCDLPLLADD